MPTTGIQCSGRSICGRLFATYRRSSSSQPTRKQLIARSIGEESKAAQSGAPTPSGLSADEKLAFERLQFVYSKGIAYGYQMGLRPQTLYGIADSPVGLAAYFLDHDAWSYALISRVFSGEAAGLTRDDVLDNITITWLTNTALSGARLYWENKLTFFGPKTSPSRLP